MLTMVNCKIINCDVGISAPKDAAISLDGTTFEGCRKALDLRDPPSFIASLGLKDDVPPRLLLALLRNMQAAGQSTEAAIEAKAKKIGLFDWVNASGSASTLIAGCYAIYQGGYLTSAIEFVAKLCG